MDLNCGKQSECTFTIPVRLELPGRKMSKQPPQPANWPVTGQLWGPAASLPWVNWRLVRPHLSLEVSSKGGDSDAQELTRQSVKNATTAQHLCASLHQSRPGVQEQSLTRISATLFLSAEDTVGPFTRRTPTFQNGHPWLSSFPGSYPFFLEFC